MFTQFFDSPRRCVFNAAAISTPLIMTACVSAAWGNGMPPLKPPSIQAIVQVTNITPQETDTGTQQRVPLPTSQRYSQMAWRLLDGQQQPSESSQSAWGDAIDVTPVSPTSSVSIVATPSHASAQNKAPLAWGSGTRTEQTPPLATPPVVKPPKVDAPRVNAAQPSSVWLQDVPTSPPPPPLESPPPSIPRAEATVAAVAKQPVTEPVKVASAPTPPRLPPPAVPIVARVAPIPPRVSAPPSDTAGFSYSSRYAARVPVAVNVPKEEVGLSRSGAFRCRNIDVR